MTTCNDCPDCVCACPVPSCATDLELGAIDTANTDVAIWVEKANGAKYVQYVTSDADGNVELDLSVPNQAFFNSFDGQYRIFVTLAGTYSGFDSICEDDYLDLTVGYDTINVWCVRFENWKNFEPQVMALIPVE